MGTQTTTWAVGVLLGWAAIGGACTATDGEQSALLGVDGCEAGSVYYDELRMDTGCSIRYECVDGVYEPHEMCRATPPHRVSACEGDAPEIDRCVSGATYADCGGAGSPTFACGPSRLPATPRFGSGNECLWFLGGCVARGYQASPCASENLCCVGDGWPFAEGDGAGATETLYAFGTEPWDRQRLAQVTVSVDAAITAAAEVTCEGLPGAGTCEQPPAFDRLFTGDAVLRALATSARGVALAGWDLHIELLIDDGKARARVCRAPFTDSVGLGCGGLGEPSFECAEGGALVLSELPSDQASLDALHGRLEARFGGSRSLRLAF